ncbi:Antiviral helicase SKI2 [Taphrina deformans PYCC 5710]|uniref:Antiviral helicase SKI2 n=1 Tax=Taphrina deformans (strain PYCC 5710 / ATCC 11124 / CBS 356.35 / IMI 108563 / JCM 9778 / NBRC 8474) TaxID=1097556 RepID=R4X874_TAPDE|nr:Antiviral helicase SKI2 [Taphrina deformans PYCC 5710]|eukprot:CCG81462.1 Antiviral helicase SKI2 [Taphrina deformans PYCC 5710]
MGAVDSASFADKLEDHIKTSDLNHIQDELLEPGSQFDRSVLCALQEPWTFDWQLDDVLRTPITEVKRSIRFRRKGLQGNIVGYDEIVENVHKLRPDNSSSFKRAPAPKDAFVRGKGSFFPWVPGGLQNMEESVKTLAELDTNTVLEKDSRSYFRRAPGLPSVQLQDTGKTLNISPDPSRWDLPLLKRKKRTQVKINGNREPTTNDVEDSALNDVDSFLPTDFGLLKSMPSVKPTSTKPHDRKWAHLVDVNRDMTNFRDLVPDLAFEHPFELDTFQKEAVYHLEQAESVFVAAHTSAGKTVVAEYAIALAEKHMTRAIYTSPIKALSNQKYRDFKQTFGSVGILTGDIQLNPEASCLIMTTEILRSMLYRGADLIRDVEFVIFDEVHYVNDQERGVVWEEVIIMLPEHVTIIMLSATVPNTFEFANWVGRTKQKDIYVISTLKRPVPLEHFLYANKKLFKIVDANKQWSGLGYKEASQALVRNKEAKPIVPATGRGRGANRGSGQRGGSVAAQGRGQAQPFVRGGMMKTMERHDKNVWIHLVNHLKEKKLLPCVIFVFSKKRCEENAGVLSNIDLTNSVEKSQIHVTIEKALARLKLEDRTLPQIVRTRELLSRGIAVHHGGLLPIVKEIVEILFSRTLVKALFATETFAMGVNMPAKSVVFSGIRKHDGTSFRDLTPGEYTQMAGRAGRRGLDPTGTVIILCGEEAPDTHTLSTMLLGQPFKLLSQFRLTYNMILNLLRVETLKIEEMIKRSFSENASQTLLPEQQKLVTTTESKLSKLKEQHCELDETIRDCHSRCVQYIEVGKKVIQESVGITGRKFYGAGRVVVVQPEGMSRTLAIILGESAISTKQERSFAVLLNKHQDSTKRSSDLLPFLPCFRQFMKADLAIDGKFVLEILPATAIEWVTDTTLKIDATAVRQRVKSEWDSVASLVKEHFSDLDGAAFREIEWDKIKSLELRDTITTQSRLRSEAQSTGAEHMADFLRVYTACHEEHLLSHQILSLKAALSTQNLELIPDYEQRIAVLQELGFIDAHHAVVLKGRVACEINSAHELILTELILDNTLAEYTCEEIVALMSAFVFEERTDNEPNLSPRLVAGRGMIVEMARRVNTVQERHQVLTAGSGDEFEESPRFGLMEVCYEWARGMSFGNITELTDVLEGTIVRCIVRLDEVLRECQSAAKTVGDMAMHAKMEQCREMIKRDVVFTASLHLA